MVYILYCIYDKIAGQYGSPTPQLNDSTAERWFLHIINKNEFAEPTDFELFKIGSFETSSGTLISYTPEFIVKGRVINDG